jgi:hypothetical protein
MKFPKRRESLHTKEPAPRLPLRQRDEERDLLKGRPSQMDDVGVDFVFSTQG